MATSGYIARRTRELAKSAGLPVSDVRSMLANQVGASGATPALLSQGNQRKIASLLKKGSSVFVGQIRTPAQRRNVIQKQARRERQAWGNRVIERENNSLLEAFKNKQMAAHLAPADLETPINRGIAFREEQRSFSEVTNMSWDEYRQDPRFMKMDVTFDKAGIMTFFDGYIEDFADTVYSNWRGSGSPLEPYIGFDLGAWT